MSRFYWTGAYYPSGFSFETVMGVIFDHFQDELFIDASASNRNKEQLHHRIATWQPIENTAIKGAFLFKKGPHRLDFWYSKDQVLYVEFWDYANADQDISEALEKRWLAIILHQAFFKSGALFSFTSSIDDKSEGIWDGNNIADIIEEAVQRHPADVGQAFIQAKVWIVAGRTNDQTFGEIETQIKLHPDYQVAYEAQGFRLYENIIDRPSFLRDISVCSMLGI